MFTIDELNNMNPSDLDGMKNGQEIYSSERVNKSPRNMELPIEDDLTEATEDERVRLMALGEIMAAEAWARQDKTEMIPFNPEAAIKMGKVYEAAMRLNDPNHVSTLGQIGVRSAMGPYGYQTGTNILETFKGRYTEEQRAKDMETVMAYMKKQDEERIRGYSIGGMFVKGISYLPAYMIEFAATGPIAGAVKGTTKAALVKAAGKMAEKRATRLGIRAVSNVVAQGARTAVGFQHTAAEDYYRRRINAHVELTEKGIDIVKKGRETPLKSALDAYVSTYLEVLSETMGEAIMGAPRGLFKYVAPKTHRTLMKNFSKIYNKFNPSKSFARFLKKAEFGSFSGEMTEEQAGAALKAMTGVEDFGAENPERMMDRVWASLPSWEELAAQAFVLGVPAFLRMSGGSVAELIRSRKEARQAKEAEIREIKDKEIEEIRTGVITPIPQESIVLIEQRISEGIEPGAAIDEVVGEEFTPDVKEMLALQYREGLDTEAIAPAEEEIPEDVDVSEKDVRSAIKQFAEIYQMDIDKAYDDKNFMLQEDLEAKKKGIKKLKGILETGGKISKSENEELNELFEPDELQFIRGAMSEGTEGIKISEKKVREAAKVIRAEIEAAVEEYPGMLEAIALERGYDVKKGKISLKSLLGEGEQAARLRRQFFTRVMPGIKAKIRERTGQTRPGDRKVSDLQALNEVLKREAETARKTRKMTLEETKKAQNVVIGVIKDSPLPNEEKVKFVNAIKIMNTREKLIGGLPVLVDRIKARYKKLRRQYFIDSIKSELKEAKVKRSGGKPVGQYEADYQFALDTISAATKLTKSEANEKIADNLSKSTYGTIDRRVVAENRILNLFSGIEEMTTDQLEAINDMIVNVKEGGKAARELSDTLRDARIESAKKMFVDIITGKEGLDPSSDTFGMVDKATLKPLREATKGAFRDILYSWNDMLNVLSFNDKSKPRPGMSFIEKFFDVFNETRAEQAAIGYFNIDLRSIIEESYGVTKDSDVLDVLRERDKPRNIGRLKNARGETPREDVFISRAQASKKWMEYQDPTLRETFESKEGMAWTPEIRDRVFSLMTDGDMAFANKQLQWYRDYYNVINPVYRDIYGTDLPFNEFYSPIRRMDQKRRTIKVRDDGREKSITKDEVRLLPFSDSKNEDGTTELVKAEDAKSPPGFGEFMNEINKRVYLNSQSLLTRQQNIRPLQWLSDTDIMQQHFTEMNRFVHWAHKIRDINDVLRSASVKEAIITREGKQAYNLMTDFVDSFTRGGTDRAKTIKWIDSWRNRIAHVAIGVKPIIMVKQLSSVPAYLEHLSPAELAAGMVDFWKNPILNYRILKESDFLKFRGKNIERDIRDASRSDPYRAYRKRDSFSNMLMLNVQIGDQGAIIVGGWALYRKAKKEGKSTKEALDIFSRVSNQAQQSADLAEQSSFQRGGSLAKLFTMFLTTPAQYLRREVGAIRNMRAGRISKTEAAKTIIIYHFMLPVLFQWISDFGRSELKDIGRAALFGNLNGLFIAGEYLDAILRLGMDMRRYNAELPIMSKPLNEIVDIITALTEEDISSEDVWKAIKGGVGLYGFAKKANLRGILEMMEGLPELYDQNYREGIGGLAGVSEFTLKKTKGKEKP